jgi:hypothetical protein
LYTQAPSKIGGVVRTMATAKGNDLWFEFGHRYFQERFIKASSLIMI